MRAILISASVALVFSLLATPVFIRFLVRRGYGQFIRDDGPTSHSTKRGTPTMSGAVIIASTFIAYAAAHIFTGRAPGISALLVLFLMGGMGLVGFIDEIGRASCREGV